MLKITWKDKKIAENQMETLELKILKSWNKNFIGREW